VTHLALITIIVDDYDEAIGFFRDVLGFELSALGFESWANRATRPTEGSSCFTISTATNGTCSAHNRNVRSTPELRRQPP